MLEIQNSIKIKVLMIIDYKHYRLLTGQFLGGHQFV